jgi:uncharacterized protein (TIGR02145 family)
MAENLNFNASGSVCYGSDNANCAKYGRLYDWATVMGFESTCNTTLCASQIQSPRHRGICPAGWHVPSDADWDTLVKLLGGNREAGAKLKSTSGWNNRHDGSSGNGTDDFGFSALPGGRRWLGGDFRDAGRYGNWWSATEHDVGVESGVRKRGMSWSVDHENWVITSKSTQCSLRCLQD